MGLLDLDVNKWAMIGAGLGLLGSKNNKSFDRNTQQMGWASKGLLSQQEKEEAERKKQEEIEKFRGMLPEGVDPMVSGLVDIGQFSPAATLYGQGMKPKERKTVQRSDGKHIFVDTGELVPGQFDNGKFGDPKEVAKQEDDLSKRFDDQSKDFQKQSDAYARIMASAENAKSPAAQMSLIFSFMKVNDPNSTVRESEFSTVQGLGGLQAQLQSLYKKVENGELLTDAQVQDIANTATGLYVKAQDQHGATYNRFRNLAETRELNPGNVVSAAHNYQGFIPVGGLLSNNPVTSRPTTADPKKADSYFDELINKGKRTVRGLIQ